MARQGQTTPAFRLQLAAAALFALLLSNSAEDVLAQEAPGAKALLPNVNCTCRYSGSDFHIGDTICLKSPNGPRLATCLMVLNNTSWKFSDVPCPTASILSPRPDDGSIGFARTAG